METRPAPARHGAEPLPARRLPRPGDPQGRHRARPSRCSNNAQYRTEMRGVDVPGGIYSHIAGIDIVRAANADGSGSYYVLEDNLRVPSGVSYMLENRKMMMRLFPELFSRAPRRAGRALPRPAARDAARGGAGRRSTSRRWCVLTPGMYNSAYFEHAFLAQQMGVELVEGQDLFVKDNFVYMRTTQGPQRVDVIYRRVDDDFLDPLAFRPDSTLGCAGLLARLPRRQRHARQRHRHRRRRRQVDLPVRAEDDRVLPRREADPATTCRPTCAATPTTCSTCSTTWTSWWSRKCTAPAATACWSARRRRKAEIEEFRARAARPTRATTSRSRRWRSRPARPSSRAASRRATSTCGPSCSRARRCRWCPAA